MNQKFTHLVKKLLPYTPNKDQESAIDKIGYFIHSQKHLVFILTGYAGTGKTSLMAALVRAFKFYNFNTVLLAPTGRAAKVLSRFAKKQAFTIHRKIYKPKSPNNIFAGFALAPNKHKNTIFIVDEASMISNKSNDNNFFGSGHLLNDLLQYVYSGKNCKLIIVGDTAQLPPVGLKLSPALDKYYYASFDFNIMRAHLSEVVRQNNNSGILYNATLLRNLIDKEYNTFEPPKFKITGFKDFIPITGEEITEKIEEAYKQVGIENTLIITRSNKMANRYNFGIRNKILFRDGIMDVDDMVMIVKNNYFGAGNSSNFIANGDIGKITAVNSFVERYDMNFAYVNIYLIDLEEEIETIVLLDTLTMETPNLPYEHYKELFNKVKQDYTNLSSPHKQFIQTKKNEFFNALQIKFAYAVTCHKAQGGQWHTVFVDQTFFNMKNIDKEYLRWLYTAITRATDRIYLVNFNKDFFEN